MEIGIKLRGIKELLRIQVDFRLDLHGPLRHALIKGNMKKAQSSLLVKGFRSREGIIRSQ